mgnify:CR=1 FL=1
MKTTSEMKMPETIEKTFDPLTDVPAWAQRYGDCVALAKADYAFRADLWAAKTAQARKNLIGQAERVLNYRLHRR